MVGHLLESRFMCTHWVLQLSTPGVCIHIRFTMVSPKLSGNGDMTLGSVSYLSDISLTITDLADISCWHEPVTSLQVHMFDAVDRLGATAVRNKMLTTVAAYLFPCLWRNTRRILPQAAEYGIAFYKIKCLSLIRLTLTLFLILLVHGLKINIVWWSMSNEICNTMFGFSFRILARIVDIFLKNDDNKWHARE